MSNDLLPSPLHVELELQTNDRVDVKRVGNAMSEIILSTIHVINWVRKVLNLVPLDVYSF